MTSNNECGAAMQAHAAGRTLLRHLRTTPYAPSPTIPRTSYLFIVTAQEWPQCCVGSARALATKPRQCTSVHTRQPTIKAQWRPLTARRRPSPYISPSALDTCPSPSWGNEPPTQACCRFCCTRTVSAPLKLEVWIIRSSNYCRSNRCTHFADTKSKQMHTSYCAVHPAQV